MPQGITQTKLQEMIQAAVGPAVKLAIEGLSANRGGVDPAARIEETPRWGGGKSSEDDVGLRFGRALACIAAGKNMSGSMDVWKKQYGFDKALEKSLSASDFTAGGALIAPAFASEVIEYLRPESVVMASGPRTMDLSTGALEVPKINQGSAASYVGENQTGGITEPEFGNLVLIRKKLKAEIPVSNDLLTFATLNADAIIRDDAVAAMAQRQDAAFIRDDGTQFTPKGLRYQVPAVNVVPASGTALTNIEADLRNAALALRDKDIRMVRPGWLMSSRTELALKHIRTGTNENYAFRAEMLAGNLNGYPFKVTTQIPEDLGGGTNESELYLADWNEVVVGEAQGLRVDSSSEAAYYDGAALRSSYSRDQTVVRVIMQHDIGMRHDFGIAVVSGVLYGT